MNANGYTAENMFNECPYQNEQAKMNQYSFNFRESYNHLKESIENPDLKKVIFHGQSPSTMLKIPQNKHNKKTDSGANVSPNTDGQQKLFDVKNMSKSKKLIKLSDD
jgi:hypothetical protein